MPIQDVQLTNKQHAVPQNIMDVEFKLIGDLTMRQFFYVVVFGLLSVGSFTALHSIFKWPAVITFALLGIGLAFVPVEDRGMDQWIINFFKSVYSPNQRIWKKNPVIPMAFTYQNLAVVKQELITLAPTSSRRKLEEYLEMRDTENKPDLLDMQEHKFIKLVKDAYAGDRQAADQNQGTRVGISVLPEETSEPIFTPLQNTPPQPQQEQPQNQQQTPVKQEKPPEETIVKPMKFHTDIYVEPMTPDRHSGRVFTNLQPSQGQIILPIRGERVLKTSEQLDVEESIEDKSQQLKNLINQIKNDEQYKEVLKPSSQPIKTTEQQLSQQQSTEQHRQQTPDESSETETQREAKSILEKIKGENTRLSTELEKLKEQDAGAKKEEIQQLEKEKIITEQEYQALQNKIKELEMQVKQKQRYSEATPIIQAGAYTGKPPIPAAPNIITGVVKNANGAALEGVVVLIKDSRGKPKRALKTNTLGQFVSNNYLANDFYQIETDGANKTGLSFAIISVEAKGQIIQPIELIGK